MWGATLPYDADGKADLVASFDEPLRRAVRWPEGDVARAHGACTAARSWRRRAHLPARVRRHSPAPCAPSSPRLFEDNPYQFKPIFRGFYFTSALQEGQADRHARVQRIAERFALKRPGAAHQRRRVRRQLLPARPVLARRLRRPQPGAASTRAAAKRRCALAAFVGSVTCARRHARRADLVVRRQPASGGQRAGRSRQGDQAARRPHRSAIASRGAGDRCKTVSSNCSTTATIDPGHWASGSSRGRGIEAKLRAEYFGRHTAGDAQAGRGEPRRLPRRGERPRRGVAADDRHAAVGRRRASIRPGGTPQRDADGRSVQGSLADQRSGRLQRAQDLPHAGRPRAMSRPVT